MSFNFATCRRVPPRNFFPNPPIDGSERPWSRATGFQCLDSFTDEQLNNAFKAFYSGFLTTDEMDKVIEGTDLWMGTSEVMERWEGRVKYVKGEV